MRLRVGCLSAGRWLFGFARLDRKMRNQGEMSACADLQENAQSKADVVPHEIVAESAGNWLFGFARSGVKICLRMGCLPACG